MRLKATIVIRGIIVTALLLGMTITTISTAQGTTTASSSSYGEEVLLAVEPPTPPLVTVVSFQQPTANGSAPPDYNVANSLASVSVNSLALGSLLTTSVLDVTADGSIAPPNATASATVDTVILEVLDGLILGARSIESTATINSSLVATGTTTIEGALPGGVLGGLSIPLNPAPNTILLNSGGIEVILNEQTIGGNGVTSRDISVNAVEIVFNNAMIDSNSFTGGIILAHSEAHVAGVVPEPSTALLLASGLAGLAAWRQMKRA